MSSNLFRSFTIGFALLLVSTACEEYEPPAEANLVRSGEGAYTVGEPLAIEFSQAVLPETFQINLWPATRGTRRVAGEDVEALAGPCQVGASSCDGIEIKLDDNRMQASIDIDDTLAGPGATFILEILPGLTDDKGKATGASYYYTIRYRAVGGNPDANIEFDDGYYILGGSVNHPMRAVLTLVTHMKVLPDGRFVMAAAKGDVDEEEVEDTSRDPNYIEVDPDESGWTIFATGLVVENDEGQRFLETEVFQVEVPVLGVLLLEMQDVRLFGELVKDDDGNDFLDGTLTYEKIILDGNEFDGDSTALLGDFVPPELVPVGAPHLCDAICGAVTGICDPPADFPHPDFCADDEDEDDIDED